MDPIEKAIRTALEKGDADDPDFRQRVYRSVEAALDRVMQANPQLTVEKAISRRKGLQDKIREIESEFQVALPEDDAALDGRLDEALLDILGQSPDGRPDRETEAMPEWPSAAPRQDPAPVSPGPADSAPSAAVSRPVTYSIAPDRFSDDPGNTGGNRSTGETGRREPFFSSNGRSGSASAPAAAPEPSISDRHRGQTGGTAPEIAIPDATSPDEEPSLDFGAVPHLHGRADADLDFSGALPPPLDGPDISAPVPESPPEVVAADRVARSREKRRPFAALFFGIALLSIAAVGLMFAFQTGLLKSPQERDTSVPNPPQELGSEDFDPAAGTPPALSDQPATQQNWISIFSPADPSTANAPGDTKAEAMRDDSGAFLRISSGASGSAVSFDVGQGVLEQLAGKRAVFNISARAEGGAATEISIECNFGELGDCGRKRYEVGYERGEFLFEIDFPDKKPGSSGTIAINSDFSGKGKAIDVYEIKAAAQ
ncbi:hypothetical protein [Arvimicrobium flavum]|uniref:hypothetical protein n=1 Tax=Arvimicrobium flavum TaxID=3393320 RepID=UPI00237B6829|nr:hypothetical protein [Mesorhizobium shangrilense]